MLGECLGPSDKTSFGLKGPWKTATPTALTALQAVSWEKKTNKGRGLHPARRVIQAPAW